MDDIRQILIVNLGGIGDFLLSTAALRSLKARFPGSRLVFLGVPRVRGCAEDSGLFDEMVTLAPGKFLDTTRGLRHRRFDMAINMRTIVSWAGAAKIYILFLLIGAKRWVGRDTDGRGFFFHIKIPEKLKGDKHEMFYDLDTVAALGGDVTHYSFSLDIRPASRQKVMEGLSADGIRPGERIIGIHVGGAPSHRWPITSYAKVIRILQESLGCRVVVTGGSKEEFLYADLKNAGASDIIDRIGRYSFSELTAFISACSIFISNDTGPMHIAAILGVPLVAIFGGGYVARYDPGRLSTKSIVLNRGVDCAPCVRLECPSMKCLKEITPDDVVNAVRQLWEKDA